MEPNAIRDGAGEDLRSAWRFTRQVTRRGTWARETALQALKAAVAAVLAWFVAAYVLVLPMPYLAPWAALVVVRPTVHWSLLTGVRQMAAVALGVVVAVGAVAVTPGRELALAVCIPVAFLVSYWPRLDDQGLYVPFTALFMIAVDSVEEPFVIVRLLETALGAGIGMGINLLLAPPARVRSVGARLDRDGAAVAGLLREIADALRDGRDRVEEGAWSARARRSDERATAARSNLEHAREGLRLNPRTTSAQSRALSRFQAAFELNQRVAHATRALADLLDGPARGAMPDCALDPAFCRDCAQALDQVADAYDRKLAYLLAKPDDAGAEPDPVDTVVLEGLRRRAHANGADRTATEMQATVLVAMRRLRHSLKT